MKPQSIRVLVALCAAALCAAAEARGVRQARRANRSSLRNFAESSARKSADSARLRLAFHGFAAADIVVGRDPCENVRFAAAELKRHLDWITGGDFRIVESAGDGRRAVTVALAPGLGRQESRIAFSANGVSLESGAFPEYAVSDFLRDYCGVRWLDPTDAGTVVPRRPGLAVPRTDRTDRPFARGRHPTGAYDPELWDRDTPGWTNYLRAAYPSAFAKGTAAEALAEISRRKGRFLRLMKSGGDMTVANHSFYGWYDRFWNRGGARFERFRPELFAQGYEGEERPPQLCYSSPETVAQAVADARAYFDGGGTRWGADAFCVEPMDNCRFCRCGRCAAQYRPDRAAAFSEHSDYWFSFVNAVAAEVAKSHPGRRISTLAYYTHCGVPSFRLEPNVVVHYCFSCNRMPYAAEYAVQCRLLRGWRAAYPKRPFGLWMYNTFPKERIVREAGVHCFPGFFADKLRDEYQLLAILDVSENIFNCGFVDDYENFLSLRWMWNPLEPLDDLREEYFSSYGAAAGPLKEFYRIVEERYCSKSSYPPGLLARNAHQTAHVARDVLGTPEVMRRLGELMAEAERLADTPLARARVANWKNGIWLYMALGGADG